MACESKPDPACPNDYNISHTSLLVLLAKIRGINWGMGGGGGGGLVSKLVDSANKLSVLSTILKLVHN